MQHELDSDVNVPGLEAEGRPVIVDCRLTGPWDRGHPCARPPPAAGAQARLTWEYPHYRFFPLVSIVEDAVFPEDSFDFINFAAVLEHLADPATALQKLTGWLKPDGVMYVEVPSSAFLLSRLVRLFYQLTGSDYVINTCPMHVPYHMYEFGLKSFTCHGRQTGYTVVFHEYFPCAGYMPKVLIRPFNAVMRWTDTGMQLAVWLRKK